MNVLIVDDQPEVVESTLAVARVAPEVLATDRAELVEDDNFVQKAAETKQAEAAETGARGQGFGLKSMAQRVRSVGGAMEVESSVGAGSVFRALLPVAEGEVPEAAPRGRAPPAQRRHGIAATAPVRRSRRRGPAAGGSTRCLSHLAV